MREREELEPKTVIAEYYLQVILKSGQGARFCGKMSCLAETCYGVTPQFTFPSRDPELYLAVIMKCLSMFHHETKPSKKSINRSQKYMGALTSEYLIYSIVRLWKKILVGKPKAFY